MLLEAAIKISQIKIAYFLSNHRYGEIFFHEEFLCRMHFQYYYKLERAESGQALKGSYKVELAQIGLMRELNDAHSP